MSLRKPAAALDSMRLDEEEEEEPLEDVPGRTLEVPPRSYREWQALPRSRGFLPLSPLSSTATVWRMIANINDGNADNIGPDRAAWLLALDMLGNTIYLIDLIAGFLIGFVVMCRNKTVVITSWKATAKFYVRHGSFWMDLIATLPLIVQASGWAHSWHVTLLALNQADTEAFHIVQLLRLLRLIRVFRLLKGLTHPNAAGLLPRAIASRLSTGLVMGITIVYTMLVLINLQGCVFWFIARREGLDNSWAGHITKDVWLPTAKGSTQWAWSVYFALTTVTTIGFGDITPWSTLEVYFMMLFQVMGVCYFGFLISSVSSIMSSASADARRSAALRERVQEVEAWMLEEHMPSTLRRAIKRHYLGTWRPSHEQEAVRFWPDLPRVLQTQVARALQQNALQGAFSGGLMSSLPPAELDEFREALAAASEPTQLQADAVLMAERQEAVSLFLVEEGRLRVSSDAVAQEATAAGPALTGLAALFAGEVPECALYTLSIEAVTECHVWTVHADTLWRLALQRCPLVLLELTRTYAAAATKAAAGLEQLPPEQQGPHWGAHAERMRALGAGMAALIARLEEAATAFKARKAEEALLSASRRSGSAWLRKQSGASESIGKAASRSAPELAVALFAFGLGGWSDDEQPWEAGGMAVGREQDAGVSLAVLSECASCGQPNPTMRCTGCRSVAFCDKACQRANWEAGHRSQCKQLRKAAAAAAAAAAPEAPAGGDAGAASSCNGTAGGAAGAPEEKNSVLPLPKQMVMSNEEYQRLVEEAPQRACPVGLSNPANTCFANSLLQCLLATPAVAAYLVSRRHSGACAARGWCVACELERLAVAVFAAAPGACVSPKPLWQQIRRIGRQFTFGRQEDAEELYVQLLDALERAELQAAGGAGRFAGAARGTTAVGHTFGSWLRGQTHCLRGGHTSSAYEPHVGLELHVSPRCATLEAALRQFTAAERLEGDNAFACDACGATVPAERRVLLEVAPNVLQVTFKRYQVSRFLHSSKLSTPIKFGESLDLAPFVAPDALDDQPATYSLYAVCVHSGRSSDYGHYIAYVKVGGSWWCCNDSSVTKVALTHVLNASAYLLFYQRDVLRDIPTHPCGAERGKEQQPEAAAVEAGAAGSSTASGEGEGEEQGRAPAPCGLSAQQAGSAAAAEAAAAPEPGLSRIQTAPGSVGAGLVREMANGHAPARQPSDASSSGAPAREPEASAAQRGARDEGEDGVRSAAQPLHASASETSLREARSVDSVGLAAKPHEWSAGAGAGGRAAASGEEQPGAERAGGAGCAEAAEGTEEEEEEEEQEEGDSSSYEFAPSANAFNLLAPPEDEAEEAEEPGSATSQQEEQQLDGAPTAAHVPGVPAESAAGQAADAGADRGPASSAGSNGELAGSGASGLGTISAPSLAALGPVVRTQPVAPAALASASSSSSTCSTPSSSVPPYTAELEDGGQGGARVFRLVVALPDALPNASDAHVEVAKTGRRQQLRVRAGPHAFSLPVPVHIVAAPLAKTLQAGELTLALARTMAAQLERDPAAAAVEEQEVEQEDEFHSLEQLEALGINKARRHRKGQGGGYSMARWLRRADAGHHTCESLLMHPRKVLTAIKGLSDAKIEKMLEAARKQCSQFAFQTAREFNSVRQRDIVHLSTGCQALDDLLGGGVETKAITEIFGEWRTGKTQICHTLCVTTQLNPKRAGRVAYIDTEGTFRPERIAPIAERFGLDADAVLDNIMCARAHTSEQQYEFLVPLAAKLAEQEFKLVVMDSVIANLRTDFQGRGELAERQQKLGQLMARLRKLAEEYNVAVVSDPSGGAVFVVDPKKPVGGHRLAKLVDHPCRPEAEASFVIAEGGISEYAG
eukprot:scaffold20.g7803.t1